MKPKKLKIEKIKKLELIDKDYLDFVEELGVADKAVDIGYTTSMAFILQTKINQII